MILIIKEKQTELILSGFAFFFLPRYILQRFHGRACAERGWNRVITQHASLKDTWGQLDTGELFLVVHLLGAAVLGGLAAGA